LLEIPKIMNDIVEYLKADEAFMKAVEEFDAAVDKILEEQKPVAWNQKLLTPFKKAWAFFS